MTSGMSPAAMAHLSAPYPPTTASLGGEPETIPDIPVASVFLALFLMTGIGHMGLFIRNTKRGHKFRFSIAFFAFSVLRILSMCLRIAWARAQHNVSLAIAANIFIFAGTIIMFIVNFFFVQRIIRARLPHIGWTKPIAIFPFACVFLIVSGLIMVIISVISSFYTLDPSTKTSYHDVQLYVLTLFTVMAFLPTVILAITVLLPRRSPIDNFGTGKTPLSLKILLVVACSVVLTLGAAFRVGIQYLPPVPITETRWYYSKACFWIFNITIDFITVFTYLIVRVDKLFWVPDGSFGPGSYSNRETPNPTDKELGHFSDDADHDATPTLEKDVSNASEKA